MKSTDCIFWDVDGVLIWHDPADPSRDWRAGFAGNGPLALWEEFQQSSHWQTCLTDADADVYDAWAAYTEQRAPGAPRDALSAVIDTWLDCNIAVNPPALAALLQLHRSGCRCAIASNQDARRGQRIVSWLAARGLEDVPLFLSCDIGAAKPDPQFFRRVQTRLPTEDRPILLDDGPANVRAARGAGWRAYHVVPGFAWANFCDDVLCGGLEDA
jgi:putative hydrolase of the HAD superfamily